MKLNKKILPLIAASSLVATTIPFALTSCNTKTNGVNFGVSDIEKYDITRVKPLPTGTSYSSYEDAATAYFTAENAMDVLIDDNVKHVLQQKQDYDTRTTSPSKTDQAAIYKEIKDFNEKHDTRLCQIGKSTNVAMQFRDFYQEIIDIKYSGLSMTYTTRVSGSVIIYAALTMVDRDAEGNVKEESLGTVDFSYRMQLVNVPFGITEYNGEHWIKFVPDDLAWTLGNWEIQRIISYQEWPKTKTYEDSYEHKRTFSKTVFENEKAKGYSDNYDAFKSEDEWYWIKSAYLVNTKINK